MTIIYSLDPVLESSELGFRDVIDDFVKVHGEVVVKISIFLNVGL